MKLSILCSVLLLTAFFVVGPKLSLEAKHHTHFSLNFGPLISTPGYVVEQQYPTYVEERVYVNPYGYYPYPVRERVYVQPAPRTYVYPSRPAVYTGFSLGFFR